MRVAAGIYLRLPNLLRFFLRISEYPTKVRTLPFEWHNIYCLDVHIYIPWDTHPFLSIKLDIFLYVTILLRMSFAQKVEKNLRAGQNIRETEFHLATCLLIGASPIYYRADHISCHNATINLNIIIQIPTAYVRWSPAIFFFFTQKETSRFMAMTSDIRTT